jgi:hypothetical protein
MKHIWDAIDLCHRKLLNERERLASPATTVGATGGSPSHGAAPTVDRAQDQLAEIDAELRAVIAARRDYTERYGEASAEPPPSVGA